MKFTEDRFVWNKCHECSILLFRWCFFMFFYQDSFLEFGALFFAFAVSGYFEIFTQRIYGLCTNSIQTDAFLKSLAVVFRTGIDLTYHIHNLTQWNPATIVPNRNCFTSNVYVHMAAVP